jgi:hypothetical protein
MREFNYTFRFIIAFLIGILTLILISFISLIWKTNIEENYRQYSSEWKNLDTHIYLLEQTFTSLQYTASVLRTAREETAYLTAFNKYEGLKTQLNIQRSKFQEIYSKNAQPETINLLEDFSLNCQTYLAALKHYEEYVRSKMPATADNIMSASLTPSFALTIQTLEKIRTYEISKTLKVKILSEDSFIQSKIILAIALFLLFITLVVYPGYLLHQIQRQIGSLAFQLKQILLRRSVNIGAVPYPSEFRELVKSIQELENEWGMLQKNLRNLIEENWLASETASTESPTFAQLQLIQQKLLTLTEDAQIRKWQINAQIHFHRFISQNWAHPELPKILLKELTNYFTFIQGVLYLKNIEIKQENLKLYCSYPYDILENKTIYAGEGLVGQALTDQKLIYVTDIPADFMTIKTGLGQTSPQSLLIVPMVFERSVVGVFEWASLQNIPPHYFQFFEHFSISFSIYLHFHLLQSLSQSRSSTPNSEVQPQSETITELTKIKDSFANGNIAEIEEIREKWEKTKNYAELLELEIKEKKTYTTTLEQKIQNLEAEYQKRLDDSAKENEKLKIETEKLAQQLSESLQALLKEKEELNFYINNERPALKTHNEQLQNELLRLNLEKEKESQYIKELQSAQNTTIETLLGLKNTLLKYLEAEALRFEFNASTQSLNFAYIGGYDYQKWLAFSPKIEKIIKSIHLNSGEKEIKEPFVGFMFDETNCPFLITLQPLAQEKDGWEGWLLRMPTRIIELKPFIQSCFLYIQRLTQNEPYNLQDHNNQVTSTLSGVLLGFSEVYLNHNADNEILEIQFSLNLEDTFSLSKVYPSKMILTTSFLYEAVIIENQGLKDLIINAKKDAALKEKLNVALNLLKETQPYLKMSKMGFILACNDKALQLLGYGARNQLEGKHFTSLLPYQNEYIFDAILERVNNNKIYFILNISFENTEGKLFNSGAHFIIEGMEQIDCEILVFLIVK